MGLKYVFLFLKDVLISMMLNVWNACLKAIAPRVDNVTTLPYWACITGRCSFFLYCALYFDNCSHLFSSSSDSRFLLEVFNVPKKS